VNAARQQIRFCRASDGVRIAYATIGDGPPLVYVAEWPTHLELEWEKESIRQFLEQIASGFTLIRYDMRGSGLSDRDATDLSLEALVRDLETVVDDAGLRRFALASLGDLAGPTAVTYASRHDERVTHLVLNAPYARGADLAPTERQEAIASYVADFGFPTFEFADAPGIDIEQHREVRDVSRQAASPDVMVSMLRTMYAADIGPMLGRLKVPALVLHGRDDPFVPFELGRELAAQIAGAEFVPFDGSSATPWAHSEVIIPEIHRFLRSRDEDTVPAGMTRREVEVLQLVAQGLSNRQIADQLSISINTADRHVSNIYTKIGASNRAEAASFAVRNGLV
jgi:pimeloyl-ACP methyl ester carboxylesterase/DNA-binding CsgD family transcriptional regulator